MTRPYTYYNITRALLAILMVGSSICTWAQNVAKINETEYATLQAAIDAATDGQKVELIANINETETYTIDKALTIDFGEYTVTASHTTSDASSNADKVFDITSTGNLTVTGTTGGVKDATVLGIFNNAGTLTINGGHYTTTTDDYGVVYNNGGTCTVAGGELRGVWAAIYDRTGSVTVNGGTIYGAARGINAKTGTTVNITNGNISSGEIAVYGEASSHITMTNGNVSATATAVYLDGAAAEANISGGNINAQWGIQVREGSSLAVSGGSISGTTAAVYLTDENSTATISGGTISGKDGISVWKNATLTVNEGANISGTNTAISGNGCDGEGGTTITINGGSITNDNDVAIYHPQDGTLTIKGGIITGKTAVEVRSGNVTITGGTLTATADAYSCNPNGNGTTTVGAALAIAQHTTKQNIAVTITGGEFTGVKAISESNPQQNDPAPQVTMSVTDGTFNGGLTVEDVQGGFIEGGTFSEAVPAEYCVDGKAPYVDENGHCTIITPATEVPTDAEALSNGSYYKVFEHAITAAGTTATTINVLKNPTTEAITITAGANITLTIADGVTLSKPITNSGALTIASGTISSAITIAAFEATVKIATGVTSTSTIALSTELQTENVLKSSTTKESEYTSYWLEKKVKAEVDLTGSPTDEQTTAAAVLATNTSIKDVTGIATNQSLTITVTSVELTNSKVMKATFEVKLIGADGQEVTGTVDPAVTFYLPISDGLEGKWANLWHNTTAIPGMNVIGATNGYVTVTTTTFSPFSYEIIENPVAQIDLTKYASVADAITDAPTSPATATEISLLVDVAATQTGVTIPQGKNIKLTIGTHTVSDAITNAGTLNICDGTNPEGTSGVISGAITNTGTLNISDKANISGAVSASAGTITISGGTISNAITTSDAAALTISNGTITGALTVGGSGTNTISGGEFAEALTATAGTLTISGGTFSKAGDNAIHADGGTINITGGTFNNTTADAITPTSGSINISGGTYTLAPVSTLCAAGHLPLKNDAGKFDVKDRWDIVDDTDLSLNPHLVNGNYTVNTAEYQRHTGMVSAGNAETMYGTICLPFAITAEPTGMKLYKAASITASTLEITEVSYPVLAGTPLIFELSNKASHMTVTSTAGEGIAVNTDNTNLADDTYLHGTYTRQIITTGLENIYYLNGDKFHQAVQSLNVPAFRAYIVNPTNSAKPMTLSIVKEGNAPTYISEVDALETVTAVYDMNGRKQNGLQRGVNIMRRADSSTIKVILK